MSEIESKGKAEPGQAHPECKAMHKRGYCVCLMVECAWCPDSEDPKDKHHPAHKPHRKPKEA